MRTLFVVLTLFSFIALLSQSATDQFAKVETKIEKAEQEKEFEEKPKLEDDFLKTHTDNKHFIKISFFDFPNNKNHFSEFIQNKIIKPPQV
jgi:hypothetical protein